jgi:signal transduction histidine kinase
LAALPTNHLAEEELQAIRATAALTLYEMDTRILAGALAKQAASLFRCERALVAVLEGAEPIYRVAYQDGALQQDFSLQLSREKSAGHTVLRHQQSYYSNQPVSLTPSGPTFALERPCRNLLTVPILNHQRALVGLIEVQNRRDRALVKAQDVALGEVFALQAAVGLERARLYDRLNDWSQSLEMLLGFNAAVNQHLSPRALIRRLVENAARFLKADGGQSGLAVPLDQQEGDCMESEGYFHRGHWHERGQRWRRMQGLPGVVLESEFPYLANDYAEDRNGDPSLVEQFGVGRALCVPIKNTEHEVLGFFELHKAAEGVPFSWQDAAFLESLGNTTAVAIRNAQLLKAVESKNRQIHALSAHNVQRLEEERRHIARELHDEAGQALIGIKLSLQVVARQIPAEMPALRSELDRLREQVNCATSQLKDLARRLRPATLDQLGIDVALGQLVNEFERLSGIKVDFDVDRLDPAPPQDCAIAIYRIAQEAITNATRYAEPNQVRLALWRDSGLLIFEFEDDGRGFEVNQATQGLGLLGMRERARILGGKIEINSRLGNGTRITLEIPESAHVDK